MLSPQHGQTTLQTLSRGLQLLEAIVAADGIATTKSLARALDLKIGTCYNLLRTLHAQGYVVRLPNGTYAIGQRAVGLSKSVLNRMQPDPMLSALLWQMNRTTRETTFISGWYHQNIVVQETLSGEQPLGVTSLSPGYGDNLHARASSKAILAHLSRSEVCMIIPPDPLPKLTERTILDRETLFAELEKVRSTGHSTDVDEFSKGVSCVSAPFFDRNDEVVGAYAISVPTDRFRRGFVQYSSQVRKTAAEATRHLQRSGEWVAMRGVS